MTREQIEAEVRGALGAAADVEPHVAKLDGETDAFQAEYLRLLRGDSNPNHDPRTGQFASGAGSPARSAEGAATAEEHDRAMLYHRQQELGFHGLPAMEEAHRAAWQAHSRAQQAHAVGSGERVQLSAAARAASRVAHGRSDAAVEGEPRDEHGRWTNGGGAAPAPGEEQEPRKGGVTDLHVPADCSHDAIARAAGRSHLQVTGGGNHDTIRDRGGHVVAQIPRHRHLATGTCRSIVKNLCAAVGGRVAYDGEDLRERVAEALGPEAKADAIDLHVKTIESASPAVVERYLEIIRSWS